IKFGVERRRKKIDKTEADQIFPFFIFIVTTHTYNINSNYLHHGTHNRNPLSLAKSPYVHMSQQTSIVPLRLSRTNPSTTVTIIISVQQHRGVSPPHADSLF
ncbi:hypothetical protein RYX36_021612, partial [Vicia faba]